MSNGALITVVVASVGIVARLMAIGAPAKLVEALRWVGREITNARAPRALRRRMKRRPIRTRKAMFKRAAHKYAEEIAGHPLSWKAARKLMRNLDRIGREANRAKAAERLAAKVGQSEAATLNDINTRIVDRMRG